MTFLKRVVSGAAALSMTFSNILFSGFTTIAEETTTTDVTVTEPVMTTQVTTGFESEQSTTTEVSTETGIVDTTTSTEPTAESTTDIMTGQTTESTTEVTTQPDLSAPFLNVNMNEDAQWNWTNKQPFNVTCSEDATIRFKTVQRADYNSIYDVDFGSYNDAHIWNNGENLPIGDNYIKFWAVYEGTERQVSSSDIKFYKFDNEKPNEFSLKLERNMWNFVLKNADKISDNYSGIKDIRYSAEYHNFTTEEDVLKLANSVGNGENFEIYLNDEMKGKQITVYVVDNAGNVRSAKIDKKNTSNIDVPKLTSATIVSLAYDTKYNDNENDDELIEIFHNKPLSYGDDRINECPATNYFYSSDNSYLKVEAVDGDMKLINLAVTVAEDVTYNVTFDVDNIAVPRLKENEENVYYIPVHDIVAEIRKQLTELPDNKVNTETTFLIEKIVVSV